MYIEGNLELNLKGGQERIIPPDSFFTGLGNLVKELSWQHHEKVEALDGLHFAHTVHEALATAGCDRILRITSVDRILYENRTRQPNNFAEAFAALDRLALSHSQQFLQLQIYYGVIDGPLRFVVDVMYSQVHQAGKPGVVILARAVPVELRRNYQESEDAYVRRAARLRVAGVEALKAHAEGFLRRMLLDIKSIVQISLVEINSKCHRIRVQDRFDVDNLARMGQPLYGFDPYEDLSYLWLLPKMREERKQNPDYSATDGSGSFSSSGASDSGDFLGSQEGFSLGDFIGDVCDSGGFGGDGGGDGGGGDGGGGGGD